MTGTRPTPEAAPESGCAPSATARALLATADWDTPIRAADDTTDAAEVSRLQAADAAYRAALRRFFGRYGLPGPPLMPWEIDGPPVPAHLPSEPSDIGLARNLVYCARCGRLLSNDGTATLAVEVPCRAAKVVFRRLAAVPSPRR